MLIRIHGTRAEADGIAPDPVNPCFALWSAESSTSQVAEESPNQEDSATLNEIYFFLAGLRRWMCLHSTLSFLRIGFGLVRISGRPVSLKGTALEYARPMFLSDTVVIASLIYGIPFLLKGSPLAIEQLKEKDIYANRTKENQKIGGRTTARRRGAEALKTTRRPKPEARSLEKKQRPKP